MASCPVCLCFSASRSKELSPGSGQKGSPGSSQGAPCAGTPAGTSPGPPPADQSPHTLRKGTSRHLHLHVAWKLTYPPAWVSDTLWPSEPVSICALAVRGRPALRGTFRHLSSVSSLSSGLVRRVEGLAFCTPGPLPGVMRAFQAPPGPHSHLCAGPPAPHRASPSCLPLGCLWDVTKRGTTGLSQSPALHIYVLELREFLLSLRRPPQNLP